MNGLPTTEVRKAKYEIVLGSFLAVAQSVSLKPGGRMTWPHGSNIWSSYSVGKDIIRKVREMLVAGGFIKSKDGEVVDAQKLHSNYEDSKLAKSFNQNIDHMIETDKALQEQRESERGEPRYYGDRPSSLGFANPPSRQLYVLLHRVGTRLFMGRRMVIAGLIRNIIVGVFFGSIYYNLSTDAEDPTSYSNRLALMFFCLIFGKSKII